jgi:ABC-type transport system involved in multi-copper enzyme maturation permease subunit
MRAAPSTTPQPVVSRQARAESVLMGRDDYFSVILRLICMELYKIRRRAMSKVLSIISIITVVGLFTIFTVVAWQTHNDTNPLAQSISEPLRMPFIFYFIAEVLLLLGEVLIVILAAVVVGGEYAAGTIRLMYTRGPSRTQLFLGKVGALLVGILVGVLGLTVIGLITGGLLNLTTGYPQDFSFFSLTWLGQTLLYLLIVALGLFIYAIMALSLSTLGRASAAGIAGVLVWSFVIEQVVVALLSELGSAIGGALGKFFEALPDYTIGKNISSLLATQANGVLGPGGPILYSQDETVLHSLLVLAVYLVLFGGLAWWAVVRRDVTN